MFFNHYYAHYAWFFTLFLSLGLYCNYFEWFRNNKVNINVFWDMGTQIEDSLGLHIELGIFLVPPRCNISSCWSDSVKPKHHLGEWYHSCSRLMTKATRVAERSSIRSNRHVMLSYRPYISWRTSPNLLERPNQAPFGRRSFDSVEWWTYAHEWLLSVIFEIASLWYSVKWAIDSAKLSCFLWESDLFLSQT